MRIVIALLAATAFAALAHDDGKAKAIIVTGLVVDTGCYLSHDSSGDQHRECATACARAGVPLAIREQKTSVLYLPVAVDHKNQNEKLMPFIEKRVTVSGTLMVKGGLKGIAIKTVKAAE